MEVINFEKSGEPIKFKFVVKKEELAVVYSIELFKKKGKKPMLTYLGDNCKHKEDHEYYLPVPLNENDERVISLSADYMGYKTDLKKNYLLAFEIYQGERLLKSIEKTGYLSSTEENISIQAQLKMN
jgi:hypothetical protein